MNVFDWRLDETAFAVLDIETTGLRVGADHIVEICVVRADPGQPLAVALDTLLDPCGPMGASRIHGIRADEVRGAPRLVELAGEVLRSLSGRVLVGHQASFDRRWLANELAGLGIGLQVPLVDTMRLRPLLGDGPRATLTATCAAYGIPRSGAHRAAADAYDTANLLRAQLNRARAIGLRTFRDLGRLGASAFAESFRFSPISSQVAQAHPANPTRQSRSMASGPTPLREYTEALMVVLADGVITPGEIAGLERLRIERGLHPDEVFALHGQAFAAGLFTHISDLRVTPEERGWLANLAGCLRALGWCPGDPP